MTVTGSLGDEVERLRDIIIGLMRAGWQQESYPTREAYFTAMRNAFDAWIQAASRPVDR